MSLRVMTSIGICFAAVLAGTIWFLLRDPKSAGEDSRSVNSSSSGSQANVRGGSSNPEGNAKRKEATGGDAAAAGASSGLDPQSKERIAGMYERAVTEVKKLERQRTKFLWHRELPNGDLEIHALVSEPSVEETERVGALIQEHLSMDSASEPVKTELLNARAELFRQFTEFRQPYKFVTLVRNSKGQMEVGESFVHAPEAVERLENGDWRLNFSGGPKAPRRSNSPFQGVKRYDYLLEFPGQEQPAKPN